MILKGFMIVVRNNSFMDIRWHSYLVNIVKTLASTNMRRDHAHKAWYHIVTLGINIVLIVYLFVFLIVWVETGEGSNLDLINRRN